MIDIQLGSEYASECGSHSPINDNKHNKIIK